MLSDDQGITEISATELTRNAASVLERVGAGERVIINKHGQPVAVIVSIETGVDLALAGSERYALLRREARAELEAGVTRALSEWREGWFSRGGR